MARGAESIHWYASPKTVELGIAEYPGQPVDKVPGAKPGTFVDATSTHAVKYSLAAGTTSVLGVLAKPFLMDWGAKAAAEAGVDGGAESPAAKYLAGLMSLEEYKNACLEGKNAVVRKSTDRGTLIHKALEQGYLGQPRDDIEFEPWFHEVHRVLANNYPGVIEWVPERPFWHKWGFGGRTDLIGYGAKGEMVVVDFKTRDFQPEDITKAVSMRAKGFKTEGRLTPRETECMQLVANLIGHGGQVPGEVANLYIDRSAPIVHLRPYTAEEQSKALAIFEALLSIFKIQRGIDGGATGE